MHDRRCIKSHQRQFGYSRNIKLLGPGLARHIPELIRACIGNLCVYVSPVVVITQNGPPRQVKP
ncbi:MAG: hypothetical protein ACK55I_31750, partial [bacterium]